MKINLVILILLFCASYTFGQTKYNYNYKQGYKFIRKAEKSLQKGKFSKTDKYLKKAMESDYGFCGNAPTIKTKIRRNSKAPVVLQTT
jgi:hypothetical protein